MNILFTLCGRAGSKGFKNKNLKTFLGVPLVYYSIAIIDMRGKKMLNQRIRILRQARGLSQVELARILGVTKQSVSNWENDNIQPSIEMLKKIAQTFGVSADYLLGLDDSEYIDVRGLPQDVVAHLRQLVEDFRTAYKF